MEEKIALPVRRKRWPRIVLLQIAAITLGLVLLEVGARVVHAMRGHAWDSAAAREEMLRARVQNRGFSPQAQTNWFENPSDNPDMSLHLHPFFAWETGTREGLLDAELAFHRSPEHEGAFDVLVLGGSLAGIFTIEEQGGARLKEILAADPRLAGRTPHLINFANGGFKQPQQVNRLVYLLSVGLVPDVVIEIDGFNEVALGNKNASVGVSPLFPSAPHWAFLASSAGNDRKALDLALDLREAQRTVERACDVALGWRLDRSCALGTLALRRIRALRRACAERQQACTRHLTDLAATIVRGPEFSGGVDEAVELSVRVWAEGSRTMQDVCRARGIPYLHVLQPTMHDEGSKPLTRGEIEVGGIEESWGEGVKAGYPKLREAGARLREQGVVFVDASRIFEHVTEALYFDNCHVGKEGNRILAEHIGKAVLEVLPSPR